MDTGAAPGKNTGWQDPAQLRPETTTKEEVASHIHRKRLLWAVPIPGTDKNGKFVTPPPSTGKSASNTTPQSAGGDSSSSSSGGDSTKQ
jgi:peptidyl-prolyl cis-trans isomerase SurA